MRDLMPSLRFQKQSFSVSKNSMLEHDFFEKEKELRILREVFE